MLDECVFACWNGLFVAAFCCFHQPPAQMFRLSCADKVSNGIGHSPQIVLITVITMGIMAVFGIFHYFISCILLYFHMNPPPPPFCLFPPFSSGLKTITPQKDANNHICVSPSCQQLSSDPILSSHSNKRCLLEMSSHTLPISVSLKEYFPHQNNLVISLALQFSTVFTVWRTSYRKCQWTFSGIFLQDERNFTMINALKSQLLLLLLLRGYLVFLFGMAP